MADLRQCNITTFMFFWNTDRVGKAETDWDLIIIKKNIQSYICINVKHNCIYIFQTIYYYTNFGNKYLQTNNIKLYKKHFPYKFNAKKVDKNTLRYSL